MASGHTTIVPAGRVQSWLKKFIEQKLLPTTWARLSNRYAISTLVPQGGDKTPPTTCVWKVSAEFSQGQFKTTMMAPRIQNANPVIGPNPTEGRETKSTTLSFSLYYNIRRFPIRLSDRSVGGNLGKFYQMAEYNLGSAADLAAMAQDYNHSKAMYDGADIGLTDTTYWEDATDPSEINAPCPLIFHPNVYAWTNAALVKNTWSVTYATAANTNVGTLLGNMDTADTFSLSTLDSIAFYANKLLAPIKNNATGVDEIQFVCLLSDAQWFQLVTDTGSNQWKDLFKYTDKGFDMVVNGYRGVYKSLMIMTSMRQPLVKLLSGAASYQYITSNGDSRVPAALTGTVGTAESCFVMGAGALGYADVEDFMMEKKNFDYNFYQGACASEEYGVRRVDLDTGVSETPTTSRINQSSFVVLTSTTAAVIVS